MMVRTNRKCAGNNRGKTVGQRSVLLNSERQMGIPLVDLGAQYLTVKREIEGAWEEILSSMRLFLGPHVERFEEEFAAYCGTSACIGVGSGTEALHLALRACGVKSGDEVVTVSHTFIATIEAIWMCGAKPVFVDVNPETYTMDVTRLEDVISPRTRAIVPVHLYGQVADMSAILDVARRYDLRIVEDASQAHGALWFRDNGDNNARVGCRAGSLGCCGTFSFYFSKNLAAYGEAGAVVTGDPEIARKIRLLRDHGQHPKHHHQVMGFNSRIDELQAAVLAIKLKHLDAWNTMRRAHAARYTELLKPLPVITAVEADFNRHVYHLYVIRTRNRDALRDYLQKRGIGTGVHYLIPCHLQESCAELGYGRGDFPITESLCGEILSLPMYPELTEAQIRDVVEAIGDFFNEIKREEEG